MCAISNTIVKIPQRPKEPPGAAESSPYNEVMRQRFVLVAALGVGLCAHATASYELALVLQAYTPANGSPNRYITRWDPMTGASFGGFLVPAYTGHISLPPSVSGVVDVLDQTGGLLAIRRMDYSTGQLTSVINTPIAGATVYGFRYLPDGHMLIAGHIAGSQRIRAYDYAGAVHAFLSLPADTDMAVSATVGPTGTYYALTRQRGTNSGWKYTVTSHASSGQIVDSEVVVDNTTAEFFDLDYSTGVLHVGCDQFGWRRMARVSGTSIGAFDWLGGLVVDASTYSLGHGDMVYSFGYDSANDRMSFAGGRVWAGDDYFYRYVPSTAHGTVYDSVIVLAPEPAALAALGLGVLALRRRRRA